LILTSGGNGGERKKQPQRSYFNKTQSCWYICKLATAWLYRIRMSYFKFWLHTVRVVVG